MCVWGGGTEKGTNLINDRSIFFQNGVKGDDCATTQNASTYRLFVWLVGFLTSSSATRLYRGRAPRLKPDNCTCCYTRDRAGRP